MTAPSGVESSKTGALHGAPVFVLVARTARAPNAHPHISTEYESVRKKDPEAVGYYRRCVPNTGCLLACGIIELGW